MYRKVCLCFYDTYGRAVGPLHTMELPLPLLDLDTSAPGLCSSPMVLKLHQHLRLTETD